MSSLSDEIIDRCIDLAISLTCPNCDSEVEGDRQLFCSETCRKAAEIIRYGRRIHKDGRINQPDVAAQWRISRAWLDSGKAYPKRERAVAPETRALVLERDGNRCQICGLTASQATGNNRLEIDHLNKPEFKDNQNHPDNLQVLCSRCHREKSIASLRLIMLSELPEERQLHVLDMDARLKSVTPLRLCDDEEHWKAIYRMIFHERLKYLKDLEDGKYDDDSLYDESYIRYQDF